MPRVSLSLRSVLLGAGLVALAAAPPLAAQPPQQQPQQQPQQTPQWQWPEKPKNIKVLPKNMKPQQLQAIMTGFTRALGVRCTHCHVGEEGKPLSTYDFVSDAKQEKKIAREMVAMLGHVNQDLKKMDLRPNVPRVNMWCHTCHHGRPRPTTLAEELTIAYNAGGIDTALAAYGTLRSRFYGRSSYDFGEAGLIEFAEAIAPKGKDEDVIRVLERNVEQFPQSPRALEVLARGYEQTNQNDKAIAIYRKMLEIDPQNRSAQRRIDALQGAAPK